VTFLIGKKPKYYTNTSLDLIYIYLKKVKSTNICVCREKEEAHFLFRVSFLWYSLIATVATMSVGLVVSFLTRSDCKDSPALPSGSRILNQATASIYNNPKEHFTQVSAPLLPPDSNLIPIV